MDRSQPRCDSGIEDFLTAATVVIEERTCTGAFNLFYEAQPELPGSRTGAGDQSGKRANSEQSFVPVPAGLALALARAAEALHLPTPVKPGQIRALIGNQSAPWHSDLPSLLRS